LIFKTSAHCLSPSAPVFTNLTIQATRLPPIRDQTRNYRFGARTPNLQAVPIEVILDGRKSNAAQIVDGYLDQIVGGLVADTPAGRRSASAAIDIVPRNWFNPNLISDLLT